MRCEWLHFTNYSITVKRKQRTSRSKKSSWMNTKVLSIMLNPTIV